MTETPRDPLTGEPTLPPAPPTYDEQPFDEQPEPAQPEPESEPAQPEPEPAQPEPEPPQPEPEPPAGPVELPASQPIGVPAPAEPLAPVAPPAAVDPGSAVPTAPPAPPPEPEPEPATEPAPAPRRRWLAVTAVATAVALLAGATGWLGWQVRQESIAESGRSDAIAAARDAARLLFSYSHDTLEEDFAAGLAVTTGEFRSEYSRTTKEVVTPVAEQYDAVVVAEVVETAIIDAGPGRATVLVFLNQGTTSTRVEGQQVDQSRVRMQLVERNGRWLVRAVDAL